MEEEGEQYWHEDTVTDSPIDMSEEGEYSQQQREDVRESKSLFEHTDASLIYLVLPKEIKKISSDWYKKYRCLEYNKEKDACYCFACHIFILKPSEDTLSRQDTQTESML